MKIIFSRKGFDSESGGVPSPIIGDRPTSIPIPARDRSETTYGDVQLGSVVEQITGGRFTAASRCHNDPMFENSRCAFGQTGAAQSHLANNGVGVGDVFLFFGLFAELDGRDPHHRIFGYLKVEEVMKLGSKPTRSSQPQGFSQCHPHTIGTWNANNTIYTGAGRIAASAASGLRLSRPTGPITHWLVPSWLRDAGLTYHGNPARWLPENTLRAVARGQEFITDTSESAEATAWLHQVLAMITDESIGE